jgi:hypothetical protein
MVPLVTKGSGDGLFNNEVCSKSIILALSRPFNPLYVD